MAEEGRLKTLTVAERLRSTSKCLEEAVGNLTGHETGIQDSVDTEIGSQPAEYLALDPTVGSIAAAHEVISAFHRQAARIAHSSLVAAGDLTARCGKRGRPRLNWYDDFTALLLEIAQKAGIKTQFAKGSDHGGAERLAIECGAGAGDLPVPTHAFAEEGGVRSAIGSQQATPPTPHTTKIDCRLICFCRCELLLSLFQIGQ